MQNTIPFVSQRYTQYSTIGCGVAATLMLLKANNLPVPKTFKEMTVRLKADIEPKKKWGKKYWDFGLGAYARDITDYLNDERINHVSINDDKKTESSWSVLKSLVQRGPVMVGMYDGNNAEKWGEGGHWIVIERIGNNFRYYDPYCKSNEKHVFTLKESKLQSDWDGYAIAIT